MTTISSLKAAWAWLAGTSRYPEIEGLEQELRARDLEIEKLRARLISALEWKAAVLDQLTVNRARLPDHEFNPRLAVRDMVAREVVFALDPTIPLQAKALVEQGAAQATQNGGLG